jgi:hypothetical protein
VGKALYLVIHSQDNWWVDFEGRAEGPFPTREAAALEARNIARTGEHGEREAQVLVPDRDGRYWVVWSSHHDGDAGGFVPRRAAG